MLKHIDKIKALLITDKILDKNILLESAIDELETRKGKVFVNIYDNEEESSCAKFFCSKGCEMNWHIHSVVQIMILIKGHATFYFDNEKIIQLLNPGDIVRINPGEKHYAVMHEYTEFYDIKIPSE